MKKEKAHGKQRDARLGMAAFGCMTGFVIGMTAVIGLWVWWYWWVLIAILAVLLVALAKVAS